MSELFPAFICAKNTGSLINSLFGVKVFHPFPSFTSSSLSSGGGMDGISITSSSSHASVFSSDSSSSSSVNQGLSHLFSFYRIQVY